MVLSRLLLVMYFNSIKVQLERKKLRIKGKGIEFQFHKGTIRTLACYDFVNAVVEFQFHKGTIRTSKKNGKRNSYNISIP